MSVPCPCPVGAGREEEPAAGPARPGPGERITAGSARPRRLPWLPRYLPAGPQPGPGGRRGGAASPPSLPPSFPAAAADVTGPRRRTALAGPRPRPRPLTGSRAAPALRARPRAASGLPAERDGGERAGRGSGPRGTGVERARQPAGGRAGRGRLPRTKIPGQGLGGRALPAPWPVPTPVVAQPTLVPRPRTSSRPEMAVASLLLFTGLGDDGHRSPVGEVTPAPNSPFPALLWAINRARLPESRRWLRCAGEREVRDPRAQGGRDGAGEAEEAQEGRRHQGHARGWKGAAAGG